MFSITENNSCSFNESFKLFTHKKNHKKKVFCNNQNFLEMIKKKKKFQKPTVFGVW